jgi:hypothetical protein
MSDVQLPRFLRDYPATCGRVEIEIDNYDEVSDCREVRVVQDEPPFEGFYAAFFPDPDMQTEYEVRQQGFVLIRELTTEGILAAVEDLLNNGRLLEAFEPPDPDANCHE